jgi:hypothetical protein
MSLYMANVACTTVLLALKSTKIECSECLPDVSMELRSGGQKLRRLLPRISLHVGAHKTATTFLQLTFEATQLARPAADLLLLTPKTTRKSEALSFHTNNRSMLERQDTISRARRILNGIYEDSQSIRFSRILLSDEQILGTCELNITSAILYPELSTRLECFPEAWRTSQTAVFLAIRNYADFFASAHTTVVRRGKLLRLDRDTRERLTILPRRWPDIISDIQKVFPASDLYVWRYEDFETHRTQLVRMMLGSMDEIVWHPKRALPSLSHQEMALALGRNLTPEESPASWDGNGSPLNSTSLRYNPWEDDLRTMLSAKYSDDWQDIGKMNCTRIGLQR